MRIFNIRTKYFLGFLVIMAVFMFFGTPIWKASIIALAASCYAWYMERNIANG